MNEKGNSIVKIDWQSYLYIKHLFKSIVFSFSLGLVWNQKNVLKLIIFYKIIHLHNSQNLLSVWKFDQEYINVVYIYKLKLYDAK